MDFYSLQFFLFLGISLLLYYSLPKKVTPFVLLIVSLSFYAFFGVKNIIFIVAVAAVVFLSGRIMQHFTDEYLQKKQTLDSKEERKRYKTICTNKKRIVLIISVILVFGFLAFFKYLEVFINFVFKLSGSERTFFHILLPLGISFYIFQSAGYLFDIYNEKYAAEKNYFRFLLFISWFPQLIQGPINRYDLLAPQLYERKKITSEEVGRALALFLLGVFKKYAIANMLVDAIAQIFDSPDVTLTGSVSLFGILLYSAQQYADFSGGIDMVLAVSQLFGIKMMQNFRQPYFSISLGDFWRRWHISLGAWMRDYIFYPMALSKGMQKFSKFCSTKFGKHFGRVLPAGIANIIVFLIVGVWHGAELHYILWGLYNGLIIALSDILSPAFAHLSQKLHINVKSKGFHIFQIIRTFIIVNIGWYFDRIYDTKKCFLCLKNLFANFAAKTFTADLFAVIGRINEGMYVAALSCIILFIHSVLKEKKVDVYGRLAQGPFAVRWLVYSGVIILVLISFMSVTVQQGFMYANF